MHTCIAIVLLAVVTVPLKLVPGHAGHRAQGATFDGEVIIDVRGAFVPGMMYVMLSRVRSSRQLIVVGELTTDMFQPVIIPGLGSNTT